MQDVCINYIRKDWTNDMISKVTDICCTDPNDPSCCATPNDIKIDRTKALVLYGFSGQQPQDVPALSGDKYPEVANWIFSHCWDEVSAEFSNCVLAYETQSSRLPSRHSCNLITRTIGGRSQRCQTMRTVGRVGLTLNSRRTIRCHIPLKVGQLTHWEVI